VKEEIMDDGALTTELDQVTAELAAARTQYASLGAKIAGLEAQQLALSKALARTQPGETGAATSPRYRTDAIVAVLEMARTEMSIHDVITALGDAGRPGESYDNVSADLAYLVERGRAKRARRGVYAATSA
jgi:hypothetical protein